MANWPWLPTPGPFVMSGPIRNRLRFGGKAAKRECTPPVSILEISLDFDVVAIGLSVQKPPSGHEPYENTAMAKYNEPLEAFTATAVQTGEQMTKQTQDYFGWLQKTMSTFPWSNTNLNRILLSNATQNVTATFAFVQKLSQAKNFQEVVRIQTEFMEVQMNSFNEQAKILGEIYANAAKDALKPSR
jgi:hypothetical protein